ILEGINLMDHNQMALHTLPGCMHLTPSNQMGVSGEPDCSKPTGCIVAETRPNSYQAGFAAAGGGVFATQFDVAGEPQYNDNVVGPGDRFNDAYFEIKYVRAYTTGGIAPTPTAAALALAPATMTSTQTPLGTHLVPSSLFYPNGVTGFDMEPRGAIGFLSILVGTIVWFLLCS
ncbi:hypothetical protein C0992_000915, partial [Termitomyces sp. T32_za158]